MEVGIDSSDVPQDLQLQANGHLFIIILLRALEFSIFCMTHDQEEEKIVIERVP